MRGSRGGLRRAHCDSCRGKTNIPLFALRTKWWFWGSNSLDFHAFYRLLWHAFRAPKIGPFGPGRCSGGPGRPCFRGFGADPGRLLAVGGRSSGPRATGSAPSNALQSVGEDSSPRGSWGVWTHQLRFWGSNAMDLRMFCHPDWGALAPPNPPLRAWEWGFRGLRGRRWGRQVRPQQSALYQRTRAYVHLRICSAPDGRGKSPR